jgi:hypothetical protein
VESADVGETKEGSGMEEIYPVIPAASKAVWLLASIGVVLLAVAGLLGATAWATTHTRVRVDGVGVHVEGDPLFSRRIAWGRLLGDEASIVAIGGDAPHRPARRTWGTGLPGYAAGWFRLRNGDRALAFVTGLDRAVHVPTRDGWALLVTVEDP